MRTPRRKKQLVIHYEAGRNQIALLEDGQLVEFYVERPVERERAGNIYMGRVVNVLPGMESAFVDIGLEKNAFLHLDDLLPAHSEHKLSRARPLIANLVREGQPILVQVKKEPYGSKGARVTTHFTIPGRWVVLLPEANYVAVSKKITSESERERLREIGEQLRLMEEGLIFRTVAEHAEMAALEQDLTYLRGIWHDIKHNASKKMLTPPMLLYRDLEMIPRLLRDIFTDEMDEIIVDNEQLLEDIRFMLHKISPVFTERAWFFDQETPIFTAYPVLTVLEAAYRDKIGLPSGGYLVIDHTEALIVIDVNTGKFVGENELEQTVFETNLEAAQEIARLMRLRDLSGMIIIDFIDMHVEAHKRDIIQKLEELCAYDHTKTNIAGWTKLGLLELTRKKVRQSIVDFEN